MPELRAQVALTFHDRFSKALLRAAGRIERWSRDLVGAAGDVGDAWRRVDLASDLGQLSGEVSELAGRLRDLAAQPARVAAAAQTAAARTKTVLTAGDIAAGAEAQIARAAEQTALGRTQAGRLAAVTEEEFQATAFTARSSGLSVAEAIAAADISAILGQGTGASQDVAGKALIGTYSLFGEQGPDVDPATEMQRVADVMAATQREFAFEDLMQLTEGFKNVSGTALSYEVPLEDTSAMLGVLNTMRITGPEAGTALKSMFVKMAPAMGDLGLQVARTSTGAVDMVANLRAVAGAGLSAEQLSKAFGDEAGPAISLLTRNLGLLDGGLDANRDSMGTAADMAATMAETYDVKAAQLDASWAVMERRIGEGGIAVKTLGVAVAQTAVDFAAWATELPGIGGALAGAAGGVLEVSSSLAGAAAGMLEMSTGVLSFTTLMGKTGPLRRVLSGTAGGISRLATGFLRAIPGVIAWSASMWGAAAAQMAALWPIAAIVAGVAAVAAGAYLVIKHWDKVAAFFKRLWDGIVGIFSNAWDRIAGEGTLLGRLFGVLGGAAEDSAALAGATDVTEAGRAIPRTLAAGAVQESGALAAAMDRSLTEGVEPDLPGSDAERGPLSRLTEAGRAIPRTLAAGVLQESAALADATAAAFRPGLPSVAAAGAEDTAALHVREPALPDAAAGAVRSDTARDMEAAAQRIAEVFTRVWDRITGDSALLGRLPAAAAAGAENAAAAPAAAAGAFRPDAADGIAGIFTRVWDRIAGEGTPLGRLLDARSPLLPAADAEHGPLSRLSETGRAIALAAGVLQDAAAPPDAASVAFNPGSLAPGAAGYGATGELLDAIKDLVAELRQLRRRRAHGDLEAQFEQGMLSLDLGWLSGVTGA